MGYEYDLGKIFPKGTIGSELVYDPGTKSFYQILEECEEIQRKLDEECKKPRSHRRASYKEPISMNKRRVIRKPIKDIE